MTPFINTKWGEADDRTDMLYPMSLRPQAHDIIRTWAFYTIVKGIFHTGKIPWKNVMISGHGLDPERKKISKSKGNKERLETPLEVINRYSSDTVRYWACTSRIGTDTFFSEKILQIGKRLVTKIWNASKFTINQLETRTGEPHQFRTIDHWLLTRLAAVIKEANQGYENYDPSIAKECIDRFFWNDFCDYYLEYIKKRIYRKAEYSEAEREGALETLHISLVSILKMFAPVMPHITEVLYRAYFSSLEDSVSIHVAPWPDQTGLPLDEEAARAGEFARDVVTGVRKLKSLANKTPGAPCSKIVIHCPAEVEHLLQQVLPEIHDINQSQTVDFIKEQQDDMIECDHDIRVGIVWNDTEP